MKQPTRRDGLKAMAAGAALAGLSGVEAVAAGPAAPLADFHGTPRPAPLPTFIDGDSFSITVQRRQADRIFSVANIPTANVEASYTSGANTVNWTCTHARRHPGKRRRLTLKFSAVSAIVERKDFAPGATGELTITITDPSSTVADDPLTIDVEEVDIPPC